MTVQSAQSVTVEFTTRRFDTGASTNADSTPTGTLIVNGTDNAASVTVTNVTTGRYKAAVTLPTLAYGDICELAVSATVNSVSDKAIVWRDTKDVIVNASGDAQADIQTIKTQTVTAAAGVTFPATISSFAGGAVSSVTGDVGGKVLGSGSGTITGTGVRADNRDGDAIPSTSGGVTVQPLQSLVDERVSETTIQAYKNEAGWTIGPVVVTDASGNAVDLTAYTTLRLIIEDQYGTDLMTTTSITVSGAGNNQWTATGTSAVTTTAPARHKWALRGYTTGVEVVLGRGIVTVTDAADE